MKLRHIALLIIFISSSTFVHAGDKSTTSAEIERETLLKTVNRGATISSENQQYLILPEVLAAEGRPHEQPQQTLARHGGSKLIETKGAFVLFTTTPQGSAIAMLANGGTTYPTVLNARTGDIGILPGTLNVKLKNMNDATAVAADHGLDVVRVFIHLQTAFYRVKLGQDVLAAAASLTTDPRVQSAEVEVIEHMNVPQ